MARVRKAQLAAIKETKGNPDRARYICFPPDNGIYPLRVFTSVECHRTLNAGDRHFRETRCKVGRAGPQSLPENVAICQLLGQQPLSYSNCSMREILSFSRALNRGILVVPPFPKAAIPRSDENRSMLLEAEGYHTQSYTDGVSALQAMQKHPPDAAILDIKMPRMDGMELLQRLRKKSEFPIIFLTSKDQEADELFGLKMGADDFIRKPFSQRLLLERLKVVLRRGRMGEASAINNTEAKVIEYGELFLDPDRYACTWKSCRVPMAAVQIANMATMPKICR